jgi:hypothetical protein
LWELASVIQLIVPAHLLHLFGRQAAGLAGRSQRFYKALAPWLFGLSLLFLCRCPCLSFFSTK